MQTEPSITGGVAGKAAAALAAVLLACAPVRAAETEGEHLSRGARMALALKDAGVPREAAIMAISTLPIVELRGAVPVGHMLWDVPSIDNWTDKIAPTLEIYVLAVVGNMIPIPLILLLLGPLSRFCMKVRLGRLFFEWLFARTRRKSAKIEKYETLGLAIFVSIPLPVTGGWTGAMAAFLMGVKFHHAMWSILLGVMAAGAIMTALSLMGWIGAAVAGVVLIALMVSALQGMLRKERRPASGSGETA